MSSFLPDGRKDIFMSNRESSPGEGPEILVPVVISFIPGPLEIDGRPELSYFPQNILFSRLYSEAGRNYAARATYLPVLETYRQLGSTKRMVYLNELRATNIVKFE